MADEIYGKGITVASGFDLGAKSPLDTRTITNTIAERNAHVTGNRVYEGMKVYVLSEKKEYMYNGTDWEEVGGITDEQLEQLTIAYEHSQTTHVSEDDIPTKVSDLTNDLSFATQNYVTNEIAKAQLEGEDIDLSGYQSSLDERLQTTDKTIVGAINEINSKIKSIASESDIDAMFENL